MIVQQMVPSDRPMVAGFPVLRFVALFAFGLVLWWLGSVVIRYGTPPGVFGRTGNLAVYAVTAVSAWLFLGIAERRGYLRGQALIDGVVVISLAALFGDGVAIAWMPGMYGPGAAAMLPGLAWLSFTVACFLLASLTLVRR